MSTAILLTPIGPLTVIAAQDRLISINIGVAAGGSAEESPATPLLAEAGRQLEAWFLCRLQQFDLPLAPAATPRGAELRSAILAIPYRNTASYGHVARSAHSGPRAIGQACRRNPFPIVIPCHRVIGAGGSIGHYSGGAGVATKLWLLQHEQDSTRSKG